jgi:hypothetical protein
MNKNNGEEKNKLITRITIVTIPVVFLIVAYFILFMDQEKTGPQQFATDTIQSQSMTAFFEPEAEDKKTSSKTKVYEQEEQNKTEQENLMKTSSLEDVFAEVEKPKASTEPAVSNEVSDNWGIPDKKPSPNPVIPQQTANKQKNRSANRPSQIGNNPSVPHTTIEKIRQPTVEQVPVEKEEEGRKFYSAEKTTVGGKTSRSVNTEIPCVVEEKHVIRNGQTIRLRIVKDFEIDGIRIPKNTMVSGLASFSNERVNIHISALKLSDRIVTSEFTVYDYDGVTGIYIPGGINQDLAKNGAGQGVSLSTNIPIVGGTISTGGQRKLQDPTVTIPAGYKVYMLRQAF